MPFWANAAKEVSDKITSEKNLQKLGSKSLSEVSARIDFAEARYFTGENQDSFVFNPSSWTEVKGANGYTPTLSPSLIHFIRKEFSGYQGVKKEPTPKDAFFTTQLSRLMESGKTYFGYIDTSIPDAAIGLVNDPANAAIVATLISPYISLSEVATPSEVFLGLAVTESKTGGFGGGGYSKGEGEADRIKARKATIEAVVTALYGEFNPANYKKALGDQNFIIAVSIELGLALPSNLSLSF
jgi:hypothetical protein